MKAFIAVVLSLCFYVAVEATITCYSGTDSSTTRPNCNYCGYDETIGSNSLTSSITHFCLSQPQFSYWTGSSFQNFTIVNHCLEYTENGYTNKLYICDRDKCNDQCQTTFTNNYPTTRSSNNNNNDGNSGVLGQSLGLIGLLMSFALLH